MKKLPFILALLFTACCVREVDKPPTPQPLPIPSGSVSAEPLPVVYPPNVLETPYYRLTVPGEFKCLESHELKERGLLTQCVEDSTNTLLIVTRDKKVGSNEAYAIELVRGLKDGHASVISSELTYIKDREFNKVVAQKEDVEVTIWSTVEFTNGLALSCGSTQDVKDKCNKIVQEFDVKQLF